ncbi:MAG TPA: multidrug efflux SMR transporter [Actinophytocola sp.]|nr:multidrug efflux SMR transporter [Actinophytocola sp.]
MYAAFGLLFVAILTEVAATSALPRTHGFRDPVWTVLVLSGYAISIWLLAVVVRTLPVSTTYAVWSGVGTAAVAMVGALWLGERLDWISVSALTLIVVGVVVLNLHATVH